MVPRTEAPGLGRVKTAEDRRCRDNRTHVDERYALPEVVERHDAQYAGHVVGENRHFGGYPWQRLRHQYVRV